MSMLVTLIKAVGASNKGKQENKIPCFVQESVFHHQPIYQLYWYSVFMLLHVLVCTFRPMFQCVGPNETTSSYCNRHLSWSDCVWITYYTFVCQWRSAHIWSWSNCFLFSFFLHLGVVLSTNSPVWRFELTTLVVIGTVCIGTG